MIQGGDFTRGDGKYQTGSFLASVWMVKRIFFIFKALVDAPSTEKNLLMKISISNILVLGGCPWQILEKIPMDLSSS